MFRSKSTKKVRNGDAYYYWPSFLVFWISHTFSLLFFVYLSNCNFHLPNSGLYFFDRWIKRPKKCGKLKLPKVSHFLHVLCFRWSSTSIACSRESALMPTATWTCTVQQTEQQGEISLIYVTFYIIFVKEDSVHLQVSRTTGLKWRLLT